MNKIIICVDDEPIILHVLKGLIRQKFGNKLVCETANDAEEAINLIKEINSDDYSKIILVISDWQMPGMKGDELLIYLNEIYPEISSIMITGQANLEAKKRVIEVAGALKILEKPWDNNELFGIIEKLIIEKGN
ncbi:MAG: response regulator [Leptospiraceae bacterium]|nr:response regulator [Leptospiraceae bacterium]